LEEFEELADLKYEKLFYDTSSNRMTDIRDLIKECPHCKTIWMLAYGCTNVYNVVCGGR
jgi:hypothetical protein